MIVTGTLSVTAISPDIGLPGSSVTITGTGFGATQGASTVALDGSVATVTSWSNTSITATVAPGTLSGNVTVTVASLTATGPIFDINGQTYLTDSLGNQTTYTSILVKGGMVRVAIQRVGMLNMYITGHNLEWLRWQRRSDIRDRSSRLHHLICIRFRRRHHVCDAAQRLRRHTNHNVHLQAILLAIANSNFRLRSSPPSRQSLRLR